MADNVTEILLRARGDFSDLTSKISGLRKEFQNLKLPKDITENLEKGFNRLDPILKSYQKQLDKGFKTKTDLKNFETMRSELDAIFGDITSEIEKVNGKPIQLKADLKEINALEKKLTTFGERLQKALDKISIKKGSGVASDIDKIIANTTKASSIKPAALKIQKLFDQQDFATFNAELDKLQNKILNLSNTKGAKVDLAKAIMGPNFTTDVEAMDGAIKRFFQDLKVSQDSMTGLANINRDITHTGEAIANLKTQSLKDGVVALNNFSSGATTAAQSAKTLSDSVTNAASSSVKLATELDQLKTSTQYFFSLRNMINLFKRGVREAVDVIKELDAAMTETAVVTEYSVGDMWKKLPEYTANANALGASVKDMYQATTLYYQQGLKTEQAMSIANETMKMARIGGLEAVDATDKMTAALRGFNMEINEVSAQRINDVYSNLAAKTASNTEELGTAMQRTASIAHSAGMSFESTAAFLAQAIETTREPAENLGTAMKTIVARFQELKKNPLEMVEVEGEEVSYNKVDTALQSIGVSLKDTNGQFRDLDKVFLDIAKKWNTLDQTQQRYIATTAAGSRQQSRFIAMMSNYDRTMELMSFANDSAGASNEQFEKTMDSLEAKLNKFKNAWNEFLMGIMNDSLTKFLVGVGTEALKILDKITDILSGGGKSGLLKSITSLSAALIGLRTAGRLVNWGIGKIGGTLSPTGPVLGNRSGTNNLSLAARINTPIVQKLNELISVVRGKSKVPNQVKSSVEKYKSVSGFIRGTTSTTMGQLSNQFNTLSNEHAYMAYKTSPGTIHAMQQSALGWLNNQQLTSEYQNIGQKLMANIFKGMNKGQISVKEGLKLLGKPEKWGQYFGTDVAKSFSESFVQQQKGMHNVRAFSARQQAWRMAKGSDTYDDAAIQKYLKDEFEKEKNIKGYKRSDFVKDYIKFYKQARQEEEKAGSLGNVQVQQKGYEQFGNTIAGLGSKFTAAGYSIQMFGSQLAQLSPELSVVANLITKLGGLVSTLGYGFAGIGKITTTVGDKFTAAKEAWNIARYGESAGAAINAGTMAASAAKAEGSLASAGAAAASAVFNPAIWAAAGAAVALVAIVAIQKHLEKKAKEAGEEVRKQFEEGFTEKTKTIDSLEDYQDKFNALAQGVDEFGHNVNLSTEEYDEYLSISRELKDLSPALIAGYNAEGEAIIKKGEALQEVIDKLEQEKQLELDFFTSNASVDKLIGEYKTSDVYKDYKQIKQLKKSGDGYDIIRDSFSDAREAINALDDDENGQHLLEAINQLTGWELTGLNNITTSQLKWLSQNYNDVIGLVESENGILEEEVKQGYIDAFTNAGSNISEVMAEGQPIIDAMQMWMGAEGLDATGLGLGENFGTVFNEGFNNIMLTGLTEGWLSDDYKEALRAYSREWERLAGENSEYNKIMTEAKDIQETYLNEVGQTDAIENYQSSIEDSAAALEQLAAIQDTSTAAGQAFAEQCIAQANALRNYATEGVESLGQALNSLADEFASAREAKNRFDEATKVDYYTAAEGYKSILETALDEKNLEGNGSLTFWAGADELLGKDYVDTHSYKEVVAQMEMLQRCFADGADGIIAFNDLLVKNAEDLKDFGRVGENGFEFDFQNEDLAEMAEILNMSEDTLAALIDKARQWVPISLGDPRKIRAALEADSRSMIGSVPEGQLKQTLYYSESAFRNEARQQGIRGDDYIATRNDVAENQNVKFLTVEDLSTKNGELNFDSVASDLGLKESEKTLDNAIAILTKMGFSLEDTQAILTSEGATLTDKDVTAEAIEKAYKEQDFASKNPTVAGIKTNTDTIATAATMMLAQMGIITDELKQNIEEATSTESLQGYHEGLEEAETYEEYQKAKSDAAERAAYLRSVAGQLPEGSIEAKELEAAATKLEEWVGEADEAWGSKIQTAASNLNDIINKATNGITNEAAKQQDQEFLQNGGALQLQEALDSGNATAVTELLKDWYETGQLSLDTIIGLAEQLKETDDLAPETKTALEALYNDYLKFQEQINSNNPFRFEAVHDENFFGEKAKESNDYINNSDISDYTRGIYTKHSDQVIYDQSGKNNYFATDKNKASLGLDSILQEFAGESEVKKEIILEATAQYASGDSEQAIKNLEGAGFNEEEVKQITAEIDVLSSGAVVDQEGLQQVLNEKAGDLTITPNVEITAPETEGAIYSTDITLKPDTTQYDEAITKVTQTEPKDIKINATKGSGWALGNGYNIVVTAKVKEGDKRGRNYSIPAHQSLSFGAAARGMNLSKTKNSSHSNVTALVGEEGFEIGYIPSQARAMILGANGPEITSFPGDTVIYPHEQSKDIIRRGKGIVPSFGSFPGGKDYVSSLGLLSYIKKGTRGGTGTTKGSNKGSSKSKTSKKQKNINNFSIEEVIRFDIDQTLEWLNSELNRREKDIEKSLEKIGNVYDNITDDVNTQLAALEELAKNNQDLADSYQRQLQAIDKGPYKEVISWTNNAGKSQEAIYDLSKYIYRDDDGVYKVDLDQIKKLTSNAEREAVFKEANSLISSLQSGLIKAQEAVDDARQQMEELGQKVSETFYQWENELTEIYDLTQRIADETSFTDRFMSQVELELSKLNTGFGVTAKSIENIRKVLLRNNDNIQRQIEDQQQMIAARQRELNRMLSSADEQERVDRFQNATGIDEATKAANIAWAEDQKKIADTALKYVTNIYRDLDGSIRYAIDWEGFNRDNANSPFNEETYKAIKDYLDDLNDAATEFNDSIKEQTDFIKDTYEALADYQKTVVDMEETLIKGVEEEIKNETDNAKRLSDSIRDQLKDLLDEVKRKLDERRKQEDNLKTERDISQKQQRLAALRADTAGGHQVEIAQLEKEIAEAQQNYGRTLEDQLLDRLQQQADEAAKQRERQIELAEKSNEINASTNKELVDLWLKNPEAYKEEIRSAWLEAQGYDEKGEAGQWALEQEFESEFAKLVTAVEQSGFNNVEQIFSATAEDVSTLVNLVNQLVNGKIGRNDNLAKDFNAQEDATIHNVISWETIPKNAEGARIARESGGSATEARAHDFVLEDLIAGGFTPSELKEANYTAAELWNAGIQNVPTLKDAGYSAGDLKDAGATIQDILNSYGPEETRNAGFDVHDFDIAEINYELAKIAFTLDELANSDTRYAELAQLDLASLVPETEPEETPQPVAIPAVTYPYGKASATTGKIKSGSSGNQVKAIQWALRQMGYKGKNGKPLSIDGKFGANTAYAVKAFQKAMKITADGVVGNQTRAKFKAKGYATGGLADYTGPAWLDGTPSKPELVLNAADTKNFLALRDVLSSAMKSTGAVNNSYGGDVTYEVNINVDKLTSDYDVDKVANRVKQIIVKDSSYRNVTQARNFR